MSKPCLVSLFTVFLILVMPLHDAHAADGAVTADALVSDAQDIDDAVALVSAELEQLGFEIDLVLNHTAAAESVGLVLRPTQVIFASPKPGLQISLLRRSDTIGLDLPLKILVFENDSGELGVRFNSTGYLADRHGLRSLSGSLRRLSRRLDHLGVPETGLITVQSRNSVVDSVNALIAELRSRGFGIPLIRDFNELRDSRRRRLPTLIVAGNPNAGTPLMQANETIGIDLPQKFLVWRDSGKVFISYNDPFFLARRHGLEGQDARLQNIANALAQFAAIGAGVMP